MSVNVQWMLTNTEHMWVNVIIRGIAKLLDTASEQWFIRDVIL